MPKRVPKGKLSFRITPELEETIRGLAYKKSMLLTGWIMQAIEEKLNRDSEQKS